MYSVCQGSDAKNRSGELLPRCGETREFGALPREFGFQRAQLPPVPLRGGGNSMT
jgi:hypothetical protein